MNKNKKGFGLSSLILSIILIALFVLLLIWLFRNYSPNMKPFYSNVFRENVSYMQDAAKSYFTNDQLPTEVGKSVRLTLKQMEEMKLLIPFVDKDGKSCDVNKSYAEVTKEVLGYTLKVNLVCGKESNYIIEILGCHDYCDSCNDNKDKTAIEYEFERTISKNITELSCPNGYTRNGNICTKKTGTETIAATAVYTKEEKKVSNVLYTDGKTQTIELATVKTVTSKTEKQYVDVTINTKTEKKYTDKITSSKVVKKYVDKLTSSKTEKEYTDSIKKITQDCHDERIKDPNCKVECKWEVGSNGIPREVCNTCGYITHKVCTDVTAYVCPNGYISEGTGASTKCYRNITTTTYSCPNGYTEEGKGSNLKCYKNVTETTYSCPNGYIEEGKGSSLKCYKNVTETTYSCGAGLIQEGTGANTKCYKNIIKYIVNYSCPSDATSNNGKAGKELKCYKTVQGEKVPYCADVNAKIENNKCVLTIPSKFSHYTCPNGYELNNNKGTCSKYIVDTVKATSKTREEKVTETKWSRFKVLEGWKATGRTRIVKAN